MTAPDLEQIKQREQAATPQAFTVYQAGDRYDWRCNLCGLNDTDWEDLESAAHVASMHVQDEHADV